MFELEYKETTEHSNTFRLLELYQKSQRIEITSEKAKIFATFLFFAIWVKFFGFCSLPSKPTTAKFAKMFTCDTCIFELECKETTRKGI